MLFSKDGYLLSIKRGNKFQRFREVDSLRDLINNLNTDKLTISDVHQLLVRFSVPKIQELEDKILITNILM